MLEEIHEDCGVALIRLLKPLDYYEKKYGTRYFGLNKLYLMMEKQHNRGQVGYCLISPVISGNIGEWICSVSRYASGECCYSSQCEDLFHNKSLL